MCNRWWLLWSCLALAGCSLPSTGDDEADMVVAATHGESGGALSAAPVEPASAPPPVVPVDIRQGTNWPPLQLASGTATISCSAEPIGADAGKPLVLLDFFSVLDAISPCQPAGSVQLRYQGRISADFTALVERVANMAERLGIEQRLLDLDSNGGLVEDAIRAGDAIGASRWMIRVGKDATCHSACVLILAAGDERVIAGKVGIHRIIRIGSKATSRSEMNGELQAVYAQTRDYLERNGAALAIADLMMTVPNRRLRVLSADELGEYGLLGANAAQDDLERIRLARECGEDFVRRKDAFERAFERECALPELADQQAADAANACGLALRQRFGFPDPNCLADSPMSGHAAPAAVTAGAAAVAAPAQAR